MTTPRHAARLATLAFVRSGDALLLLRRPPHASRFAGLWNGVGGHVEAGEDIRAAAHRELREEAGLHVAELRLRAVIHETDCSGQPTVVFVFAGESPSLALSPQPGLELAWHSREATSTLPLVADVPVLLERLFEPGEPAFLVHRFDDADRPLAPPAPLAGVGVGGNP